MTLEYSYAQIASMNIIHALPDQVFLRGTVVDEYATEFLFPSDRVLDEVLQESNDSRRTVF